MPIDNGSSIWPKILTCSLCEKPVERGSSGEYKVGERFYSCPTCETSVPSAKTHWVKRAHLDESVLQAEGKRLATEAGP